MRIAGGFTLLELVIVLAILAALTTVAVRSLDGVEDQSRYEATRRSLDNIQAAVLGADNERDADGSLLVTGFVADLGRLPKAYQTGSDPGTQLQELWNNPNGLQPFAIYAAPDDSEVVLGTGWRGGYLRLSLSASSLTDGWGQAYGLTTDGSGQVVAVSSSGAAAPYNGPIQMNLAGNPGISYTGTLYGNVYQQTASGGLVNPTSGNGQVVVLCFGPDPTTGRIMETAANVTPTLSSSGTATSYSAPATIGPRVLRAYQISGGTPPPAGPVSNPGYLFQGASLNLESVPVRIMVQPGGQGKNLILLPPQ